MICEACNGSGEGFAVGSVCSECRGVGETTKRGQDRDDYEVDVQIDRYIEERHEREKDNA